MKLLSKNRTFNTNGSGYTVELNTTKLKKDVFSEEIRTGNRYSGKINGKIVAVTGYDGELKSAGILSDTEKSYRQGYVDCASVVKDKKPKKKKKENINKLSPKGRDIVAQINRLETSLKKEKDKQKKKKKKSNKKSKNKKK